jgi:mannose-6-phosphate isomerase-like protein (cupin superfamily)
MVKSATVMEREVRERMRGGTGSVEIRHVFRREELGGGARLFARLSLPPGSSIGHHVHDAEEEVFYILAGRGVVTEDGVATEVGPGDAVLTGGGGGHALENRGTEPLELMAVILNRGAAGEAR